jgi:membrane protease YdiL (CAAX protease family)
MDSLQIVDPRPMLMRQRPAWHVWVYFAWVAILAFGGTFLAMVLAGRDSDPSLTWLLKCTLVMVLVVALTAFYMRRDGLFWSRYGVSARPRSLMYGFAGFTGGMLLALGWAGIVGLWAPFHWQVNLTLRWDVVITGTVASFAIGVAEEVGYRSYGMERLYQDHGAIAAALLPTIIFVAAHLAGGLALLPGVLVVGSSGLLYASLMLATRSLPFVAAFHIANNVGQDALLRTSDGSIWQPVFRDSAQAQSHGLAMWLSMAALNLVIAACAWRYRARYRMRLTQLRDTAE